MMVNKYILIIITLIITLITNSILKLSFLKGGIITVIPVVVGYIIYIQIKQTKRYKLLEEDLDPEAFIESTYKAYRYAENNKQLNSMFNMDLAFGYMSLGEYNKTLECLDKIDPDELPKINNSIISYYTLLMISYYNIDDFDRALINYEKAESYKLTNKRAGKLIDLLKANRYLYEREYARSKELFEKYPKDKISKRLELEILYILAYIDEKEGNEKDANLKYEIVAKNSNKLYIGKLAKEKVA